MDNILPKDPYIGFLDSENNNTPTNKKLDLRTFNKCLISKYKPMHNFMYKKKKQSK